MGAQQLGGDMPWPGRAGMVLAQSWDTLYVHNELLCCFYPENETTVTFYMSQGQCHQRQPEEG